MPVTNPQQQSSKLIFYGLLLFLFGLVTGLIVPFFANPRMGLSAHMEGVMNGMFLIILGLLWKKLVLSATWLRTTYWLLLYGAFANFSAVILAAITGNGKMMPLAGGREGTDFTEALISFLLVTLALSMITVCIIVLTGFYKYIKQTASQ